jgi:hypothetical protein
MVWVLQNVAIDCADAYELARFWSRVTGHPLHSEDKPGDPEVQVLLAGPSAVLQPGPRLTDHSE